MRRTPGLVRAAAMIHAGIALALSAAPALAQADLVVKNAVVWPGAGDNQQAFAVRSARFTTVGSNADVEPLIGENTKVIDAGGRFVIPGLIDTHIHLGNAAEEMRALPLRDASSRDDLLRRLREHAATLPEDAWVVGARWSAESWPDQRHPTAQEIQQAVGARPAVLIRMDGHMLLASTAALAAAGVSKDGPADPPGGKIGRATDGAPTGEIFEEAMEIVTAKVPPDTDPARSRERMLRAVRECVKNGLTMVGAIETRETIEGRIVPLDKEKALPLRVAATVWNPVDTVEGWKPTLEWARDNRQPSPRVRVLGFKGYMDGSLGSRTAWMMKPFTDDPKNSGMPLAMAGNGTLRELIRLGASMNLQPAVHAIGDRANHTLLNWYADLPDGQRVRTRPRIEHAQHLLPEDIARFLQLGVAASMQPYHKADDGRYAESRLGTERIKTSYAFASLMNDGARVSFGSDWPVVSNNPFLGMWAAITAKTLDGKEFVPDETIHVEDALHLYTTQAAWVLHAELTNGRIAPGLFADFVMLDRDFTKIPYDEVKDTRVLLTAVGGVVVFEATP